MDHQNYDPISRYPPSKPLKMIPGCATLRLLEQILNPNQIPISLLRDAILVSIDLEYMFSKDLKKHRITQIGVATLDTKLLPSVDIDSPDKLRAAVQGRCFSLSSKRVSAKSWTPSFLWGELQNTNHDEVRARLKEVLHDTRDAPGISSRNVILVGHGICSDRRVLIDAIGYDIKEVPSVKAILDTGRMMCSAYDFGIASHSHFPLNFSLRCLGVHYDQIHNAGNDAMFTMKALLLIFTNWRHQKGRHLWNILDEATSDLPVLTPLILDHSTETELLWESQIELLTAIAREPWFVPQKSAIYRPTTQEQAAKTCWNDPIDAYNLGFEESFETAD